jgi:hypothetical protein
VVGRRRAGVDHRLVDRGVAYEGVDTEVEVGLRAGDGGAKVVVCGADVDGRGIVAVDGRRECSIW